MKALIIFLCFIALYVFLTPDNLEDSFRDEIDEKPKSKVVILEELTPDFAPGKNCIIFRYNGRSGIEMHCEPKGDKE